MGDFHELFQEGYLTIPIDSYPGAKAPQLSKENLELLIIQLYNLKAETSTSDLLQSNFAYWLTYALQSALDLCDEKAAQQICALLYQLYTDENPAILVAFFEQPLGGKFEGQTVAYAWMDHLYSATFDFRNNSVIVAINYIFNQLLESSDNTFTSVVAKNIENGSEKGKNAILVLVRALANAVLIPNNQSTAELIAELLNNFVKRAPYVIGATLSQEIIYGSFNGKSCIYMLASAIKNAVENNPKVVQILCRILLDVNKVSHTDLVNSLCKIHELGPYKGKHALHIILTSLVSAAYINQNAQAVNGLINAVHRIWENNSDGKINTALTQIINTGEHTDLNGIMMIVRALIAAMDHQLQTASIVDFLGDFIKSDSKELGSAFTHYAAKSTIGDYTVSPLMRLISTLKNIQDPSLQTSLSNIINKLAASESAFEMLLSLPDEPKSIFMEALATERSLSHKEVVLLIETANKHLKPGTAPLTSSFFLTKNNHGFRQSFFAESCSRDDIKPKKDTEEMKGRSFCV